MRAQCELVSLSRTRIVAQELVINIQSDLDLPRLIELCPCLDGACPPKGESSIVVIDELGKSVGERAGRSNWYQCSGDTVIDHLATAADVGRNYW